MEILIKDQSVSMTDNEGFTPFYSAASSGNTEMVSLLLGKVANVDEKTLNGSTPLSLASFNGIYKIFICSFIE